jgi:hypothetical protein
MEWGASLDSANQAKTSGQIAHVLEAGKLGTWSLESSLVNFTGIVGVVFGRSKGRHSAAAVFLEILLSRLLEKHLARISRDRGCMCYP